jgi:hypothetical protein
MAVGGLPKSGQPASSEAAQSMSRKRGEVNEMVGV